jgi:hypothetical protein
MQKRSVSSEIPLTPSTYQVGIIQMSGSPSQIPIYLENFPNQDRRFQNDARARRGSFPSIFDLGKKIYFGRATNGTTMLKRCELEYFPLILDLKDQNFVEINDELTN